MIDLEVHLDDKNPLQDNDGRVLIDCHRELLKEKQLLISDFMPEAYLNGQAIHYSGLGGSTPAMHRIPLREYRRLKGAVEQIEAEAMNPRVEASRQRFLQNLRFPDPDQAMPEDYPLRLDQGRLKLLWGYDYGDDGGLSVQELLDLLRRRTFPPDWPTMTYASLGLTLIAVLLLATGLVYWALIDKMPPHLETTEIVSAKSIRAVFDEEIADVNKVALSSIQFAGSRQIESLSQPDNRTYLITFSPSLMDQEQFKAVLDEVRDRAGNAVYGVEVGPMVYTDHERPTVVDVRDERGYIVIEFNEPVVQIGGKVTFVDPDLKAISSSLGPITVDGHTQVRTINRMDKLQPGQRYKLEFSGVTDNSSAQNSPAPYLYTHQDQTPPSLMNAYYQANGVTLVMHFSEPISAQPQLQNELHVAEDNLKVYYVEAGSTPRELLVYTDHVSGITPRAQRIPLQINGSVTDMAGNELQVTNTSISALGVNARPLAGIEVTSTSYSAEGVIATLVLELKGSYPREYTYYSPLSIKDVEIVYGSTQAALTIDPQNPSGFTWTPSTGIADKGIRPFCDISESTSEQQKLVIRFPQRIQVGGREVTWNHLYIRSKSHGESRHNYSGVVRLNPVNSH